MSVEVYFTPKCILPPRVFYTQEYFTPKSVLHPRVFYPEVYVVLCKYFLLHVLVCFVQKIHFVKPLSMFYYLKMYVLTVDTCSLLVPGMDLIVKLQTVSLLQSTYN